MADTIRESLIQIKAENKTAAAFNQLKGQMRGAAAESSKLSGALSKIGIGLSFAAVGFALKKLIDDVSTTGDSLNKMSEITGNSVESLSKLRFAAKLSNVEFDALGTGLQKLSINLADAKVGLGTAVDAFAALKIDPRNFKASDDALLALADRFKDMQEGAQKTALAAKIFGLRMGPQLIPLLNLGSEGIKKFGDRLKELGGVITKDMAQAATDFADQMTELGFAAEGLKFSIGLPLLKTLTQLGSAFATLAGETGGAGDAFNALGLVLKVVVLGIAAIGSAAAETARDIGALTAAAVTLFTEGPRAAASILTERGKEQEAALNRLIKVYQALFEEQKKAALPKGGKIAAPEIVNVEAIAKASAEREIKRLDRVISIEERTLGEKLKRLQYFFEKGFLPISSFFESQRKLLEETTRAQVAAVDQQIKKYQELAKATGKPEEREKIEQRVDDLLRKRADLIHKTAIAVEDSTRAEVDATEAFSDQVAELNARLAELQGRAGEAFKIRFEIQDRKFANQLAQPGNEAARAVREQIKKIGQAEADINTELAKGQQILEAQRTAEDRLNLSREAGALSELGLLGKLSSTRSATLPQLEEIAGKITAIAKASDDPRLKQLADNFKVQVERMKVDANILAQKFESIFADAFGDELANVLDHTKSLKQAFSDMTNSIVRDINRLVARSIADELFGGLFSAAGSKGTGGGLGSGIGDFFANLFKSAKGAAFSRGVVRLASGGIVQQATPFAFAGGLGVMGEAGPEAVLPLRRGADGKLGVHASGGAVQVTNHFTISGSMGSATQAQIAAAAGDGVARALRRNR